MSLILEKYHQILSLLIENEVEFIVVGGYAVILHGYIRTTGDLDIWLKPDNQNKANLIKALEKFGITSESRNQVANEDFQQPLAFNMGEFPEQIEFMTFISGLNFDEANENKIFTQIENQAIPFLNLDHLILSKMSAGRLKDLADVEELQKIIQFRKNI